MALIRTTYKVVQLSKILSDTNGVLQTAHRSIKRWVAPTLMELNLRSKKVDMKTPIRSGFIEWNYKTELFAFGKRLHEEFDLSLLQVAFTQHSYIAKEIIKQQELGIKEVGIQMDHNDVLSKRGAKIAKEYVELFLKYSLPKVPNEGLNSIASILLNKETLSEVGFNLGMKDLLLETEYPPSKDSMAKSLLAVIGALEQSSNIERAFLFVRDFICTKLNQKDILELWPMDQPEALLKRICVEKKISAPEPRILGDCGKNTVLAAYYVGLYSDKKLIGKGFGEDISSASKTASLDALKTMFDINDNMKPFNFNIDIGAQKQILNQ